MSGIHKVVPHFNWLFWFKVVPIHKPLNNYLRLNSGQILTDTVPFTGPKRNECVWFWIWVFDPSLRNELKRLFEIFGFIVIYNREYIDWWSLRNLKPACADFVNSDSGQHTSSRSTYSQSFVEYSLHPLHLFQSLLGNQIFLLKLIDLVPNFISVLGFFTQIMKHQIHTVGSGISSCPKEDDKLTHQLILGVFIRILLISLVKHSLFPKYCQHVCLLHFPVLDLFQLFFGDFSDDWVK